MKNRIAELRKNEGISQAELAAVLGISRELLSRIENDKCDLGLSFADKISRHFRVTLYDVFTLSSEIDYDYALKNERADARNKVFDSMMKYSAAMMEG